MPSSSRTANARSPEQTRLPILQVSRDAVTALSTKKSLSIAPLRLIFDNDPAATVNLLADINAKLHRMGKTPVTDTSRALLFGGFPEIITATKNTHALEDVVATDQQADLLRMLYQAHHASHQAHALSRVFGGLNADEIATATTVEQTLGYATALRESLPSLPPNTSFSKHLAIENMPANNNARLCMDLAARFASATASAWIDAELDTLFQQIAEHTGRSEKWIAQQMKRVVVESARRAPHFATISAARRLMCPGISDAPPTRAAKPSKIEKRAIKKRDDKIPRRSRVAKVEEKLHNAKSPNTKATHTVSLTTDQIARAAAHGHPASKFLPFALQRICDHAKVASCVLFLPDKEEKNLYVRASRGLKLPANIKSVATRLESNPLLAHLCERSATVHFDPQKHGQLIEGLPRKLLGGMPGLLCSLHLGGRFYGIILAGRASSESPINDERISAFRAICVATANGIEVSQAGPRDRQRA